MNHTPQDRTNDVDEREWLAQERALRDERDGASPVDDPVLAPYRTVVRALRKPIGDGLPADFARAVAARCRASGAAARVDLRLERRLQRTLLGALAVSGLIATALHGGDWVHAASAAMPMLGNGAAVNWATALACCVGLSWAMDAIRRHPSAA